MTRKEAIAVLNGYTGNLIVNNTKALEQKPNTGHWIKLKLGYGCSECSFRTNKRGINFYRYCPNCGAKMQKNKER